MYARNDQETFAMTNVQNLLRQAELDAEKTSAIIRLIVFVSLATVIFSAADPRGHAGGAGLATAFYGLGTAAGLFLAWRRIFHPVVPYLFVTFDVLLVVAQVVMLAGMMGMQASSVFALPAAALIFVILIHASMRYRPWLVVHAAILFVVAIEVGPLLLGAGRQPSMAAPVGEMASMSHAGMTGLLNYQLLPVALIGLAAFILFVIGRRTKGLLISSIQHSARTAKLSRYFSPNLASSLADGDVEQTLAGSRRPAAVLFVDIRGFTTLGEAMAPEELGAFLSEYRNRLARPIFAHGGTVDKFIGDGIMAVFGSPVRRDDDAVRAVRCGLDILAAAARWSSERENAGLAPVAIGIGAHYGEVFAGVVGGEELLEFTVIGDTVNVAERLEGRSRQVGSPFVISVALAEAAGDIGGGAQWRRLPPQDLKGHRKPVEALCLAHDRQPSTPA